MAKYSRSAGKDVKRALERRKKGTLKSGKGGKGGTVKSRKQAIAIALSEARKKGKKVPKPKKSQQGEEELRSVGIAGACAQYRRRSLRRTLPAPMLGTAAWPSVGRCAVSHDPNLPFPKLILSELTLLRRLASDRRTASAKMPTLRRTGLAVLPPIKARSIKLASIRPILEPAPKPIRKTQRPRPGDHP